MLGYPRYELLFCVSDERDAAKAVVEKLMREFPAIDARLFVSGVPHADVGPNPKVNNLVGAHELARYDWILISDSNVRAPRNYLARLAPSLHPKLGILTSIVVGKDPRGIGGELEAVFLNTFYARWMILTSDLGKPCVVGKSMLYRRSVAERFGGLKNLGRYIAEDYMAGQAMIYLGYDVDIARKPVIQHIGKHSLKDFWSRHLRWGRIRKSQAPLAFACEPLMGFLVSGIYGSWALSHLLGVPASEVFAFHALSWWLCEMAVIMTLKATLSPKTFIAWWLREIIAVPLWVHIAMGRSVKWRGNSLSLGIGGLLTDD